LQEGSGDADLSLTAFFLVLVVVEVGLLKKAQFKIGIPTTAKRKQNSNKSPSFSIISRPSEDRHDSTKRGKITGM